MPVRFDTHIFRVSNRTGIAPGKDPLAVEQVLNEVTPDEFKLNAHHWLLLHGRYVCIARLPACPKCIIRDLCEYEPKTPDKDLPKSDAPVARNAVRAAKEQAKAELKRAGGASGDGAEAPRRANRAGTAVTAAMAGAARVSKANARAPAPKAKGTPARAAKPGRGKPAGKAAVHS